MGDGVIMDALSCYRVVKHAARMEYLDVTGLPDRVLENGSVIWHGHSYPSVLH